MARLKRCEPGSRPTALMPAGAERLVESVFCCCPFNGTAKKRVMAEKAVKRTAANEALLPLGIVFPLWARLMLRLPLAALSANEVPAWLRARKRLGDASDVSTVSIGRGKLPQLIWLWNCRSGDLECKAGSSQNFALMERIHMNVEGTLMSELSHCIAKVPPQSFSSR